MVVSKDIRQQMPLVLLVGAVSVALVIGVSVLRYVAASGPSVDMTDGVQAEVKSSSVVEAQEPVVEQIRADTVPDVQDQGPAVAEPQPSATAQGSVTVNGQTHTVTGDGELHTTTTGADGQTSIDISVQSSGSGQNYNSSSSNVQMNSSSYNMTQSTGGTTQQP